MLFGIVATITPLAWFGAIDWPVWLKLLMSPISGLSLVIANDFLNDVPRQVDNIYRRWNDQPLREQPAQPARRHQPQHRRYAQPHHVRIVKQTKGEES